MAFMVPGGLRQLISEASLDEWVDNGQRCDLLDWFEDVTAWVTIGRKHGLGDMTDEVVPLLAKCLDRTQDFNDFVVQDSGYTIGDSWPRVVEAAAWAILKRYDAAVSTGAFVGEALEA
ncbi:hypothetical protein SFC79_06490 [Nocardioides sp. S-58]|uniref:Uncharacterized protein n=1 Tax=Nocardioides renjunii TaxID=3095075 RepID=A0ABU5K8X3_9ACTN|nr:hypothetical protein [Nocardioides sp. S-58]MDZ5661410.1 hypothetical protein [Nocardioides sp. S-58]